MSCDWCARVKGVRQVTMAHAGLPKSQRMATFGRAGQFLPRCSRNRHWVSPANPGFCRPCGEDQRNPDGSQKLAPMPWPPAGVYTQMSAALTALESGQIDTLVDTAAKGKELRAVLTYDDQTGEFTVERPAQPTAAAPPAVPAAPHLPMAPSISAALPPIPELLDAASWRIAEPAAVVQEVEAALAEEPPSTGTTIRLDEEQVDAWASKILTGEWQLGQHTPADVQAAVARRLREIAEQGDAVPIIAPAPPTNVPAEPLPASLTPVPLPETALQANPAAALVPQSQAPQGVALQMATLQGRIRDWYRERQELGLVRPITPVTPPPATTPAPSAAPFDPGTLHSEERDRLGRAAAVQLTDQGGGVYEAQGSGDSTYTVDLNARSPFSDDLGREIHGTCTCKDFTERVGPAGLRCKHLLAAEMAAGTLGVGAAEQVQEELGSQADIVRTIQQTMGIVDPPAPSFGDTPAAQIDPTFQLTPEARRVLQYIGGALRMGYAQAERGTLTMEGRSFGLFGPPGTGKNTVMRQAAASLGLPYSEITVDKRTDLTQLIGNVTLEEGSRGGTVSTATLGPLGKALLEGGVITINEINTMDPYQQSALYQILQDGTFTIQTPEGVSMGTMSVHPSTVVGVTWNPLGGEADRPIPALYSRLYCTRMDYPPEDEEKAMLSKWAEGRGLPVVEEDMTATVRLVRALRSEAEDQAIDLEAGYRDAQHFYTQLQSTGSLARAAESLQGLASQTYDYDTQWATVETYLQRFFGERYTGVGSGHA